jgi:oligo-1,6-glucosidase
MSMIAEIVWWKIAVFYAIWPRSFNDSNGDGIGDINGITQKLDYLQELGVTAVWLSPIFKSPGKDFGYDVSNYLEIDPEFGTLEDVKTMLKEAKERGIKFIFDLVINHTSNEHEWFQKSIQKIDKFKDYYIWNTNDEKNKPPSNWGAIFGGSVWEFNKDRENYYFHMFAPEQPDLNLSNNDVLDEIKNIVEQWTNWGVSGFRLDAASHFSKNKGFPAYEPEEPSKFVIGSHHFNGKGMHEILKSLNNIIKKDHTENFILGELAGIGASDYDECSSPVNKELDMIISFDHLTIDTDFNKGQGRFSEIPFK